MAIPNKASLSPARRRLLQVLQQINFGQIKKLAVHNGQPVFEPPPTIVREHKFGGENGPRSERGTTDFLLKQQVVELFTFFDETRDSVIDVLEIKHGLPFRMFVTEVAA